MEELRIIGFLSRGFFADGELKKVSVYGGAPMTLCDTPNARGGSWGPNDIIVFAQKIPNSQGVFANWDFDNADQAFSNVFGRGNFTPPALHGVYTDGGIRLTTGSNP